MILSNRAQFVRAWMETDIGRSRCFYCGQHFGLAIEKSESRTRDHIIAKSHGGTRYAFNKVFACRRCNQRKGHKTIAEFRQIFARSFFAEDILEMHYPTHDASYTGNDMFGYQSLVDEHYRNMQRRISKIFKVKRKNDTRSSISGL